MNIEWKKGYEEGFAAGWKAAKSELSYTNFPPVYYRGGGPVGTYNIPTVATMADTPYSSTVALTSIPTGCLNNTFKD